MLVLELSKRLLTQDMADLSPQQSILDCSEANEGFYVKCGFKRAGLEMAHYYDQAAQTGKVSAYYKS